MSVIKTLKLIPIPLKINLVPTPLIAIAQYSIVPFEYRDTNSFVFILLNIGTMTVIRQSINTSIVSRR